MDGEGVAARSRAARQRSSASTIPPTDCVLASASGSSPSSRAACAVVGPILTIAGLPFDSECVAKMSAAKRTLDGDVNARWRVFGGDELLRLSLVVGYRLTDFGLEASL